MTWVYAYPQWLVFAAGIGAAGLVAAIGLAVYRTIVPQSEDVSHNDVAGPIIATVGTILAVIVSFMLVTVWQEYDQASASVEQEASATIDLYHVANELPQPVQSQLRKALRGYAATVIDQEWPAMRTGNESADATRESLGLLTLLVRYEPKSNAQQTLQQDAISLANTIVDGRRDRLFDNSQGIPPILWAGMLVLGLVTLACSFVFRIRNQTMHVAMSVALAMAIGVTFVLIAEFDYPFRGDGQISPDAWRVVQGTMLTGSD